MEPEGTGIKRKPDGTFEKGVSGNPEGRPAGSVSVMTRIRQIFNEEPEYFELYVRDILKDERLRKEIVQQLDGKPKQTIDLGNSEGIPFIIKTVNYGADTSPQV